MEVPRTTVDELKAMMDSGEPVIILDVRQPEAYAGSNKKIKGAVYLDPNNDAAIKEFARGLDRNAAIVAYCT
ncbi:MAG: rhodanese-like domain-containing protein [Nitrospiraceae bacterium]|nr:rhodanese-like domain-containing protein [Nitrospiraceae bacterium]